MGAPEREAPGAEGVGSRAQGDDQRRQCAYGSPEDQARKRRDHLAAELARRGYQLHQTEAGTFIVARWNLASRELPDLDAVERFAARIGVAG